jgi:hypothetical protein
MLLLEGFGTLNKKSMMPQDPEHSTFRPECSLDGCCVSFSSLNAKEGAGSLADGGELLLE